MYAHGEFVPLRLWIVWAIDELLALMAGWLGRAVALVSTTAFWSSQAYDITRNPQGAWLSTSLLSAIFLGLNFSFQYDKWERAGDAEKVHALSWLVIYLISMGGAVINVFVVFEFGSRITMVDALTFLVVALWLTICLIVFGKTLFRHETGKGWAAAAFRAAPRVVKAAEWPFNGAAVGIITSLSALVLALQRFLPAWYSWRRTRDHADFALMISEGVGNVVTTLPLIILWAWFHPALIIRAFS